MSYPDDAWFFTLLISDIIYIKLKIKWILDQKYFLSVQKYFLLVQKYILFLDRKNNINE